MVYVVWISFRLFTNIPRDVLMSISIAVLKYFKNVENKETYNAFIDQLMKNILFICEL